MHDAGRLVGLQGAAVRGEDVVGQIGEIEIGLPRQGPHDEKAFKHPPTQFVDDVQS